MSTTPPPPPLATATMSTPRTNNNSQYGTGTGRRPPKKPAGVPLGASSGAAVSGSSFSSIPAGEEHDVTATGGMRDNSERSRTSLRETVIQRRASLTLAEQEFLLELTERGNEIEVQMAYETLLDEDLFFLVPPQQQQLLLEDTSEQTTTGWRSDLILMGKEREDSTRSCPDPFVITPRSSATTPHGFEITNLHHLMNMKDDSSSRRSLTSWGPASHSNNHNLGSERRQKALQERRHSLLHGKMWKAHETGLAVSSQASHRSVQARAHRHQLQLSQQQQHQRQNIFRRAAILSLDDSGRRSDGNRGSIRDPQQQRSGSSFWRRGGNNSRPVLNRMPSEGSRKSVTFATPIPRPSRFGTVVDDPIQSSGPGLLHPGTASLLDRRNSVGSISNSIGSIPSLHHGHPVTSGIYDRRNSMESLGNNSINSNNFYSRRDSLGSIPSIHHGHLVLTAPYERCRPYERSLSIGSVPSIHHGHHVTSPRTPSGSFNGGGGAPLLQHAHSVHSTTLRDDSQNSDITASEAAVVDSDFLGFRDEKKMNDPPVKVVIPDTTTTTSHSDNKERGFLVESTKLLHTNDPDAPHQLLLLDDSNKSIDAGDSGLLSQSNSSEIPPRPGRPVIMREASSNNYKGEGLEVADWLTERQASFDRAVVLEPAPSIGESLVTFGDGLSIKTSNSFDERMSHNRVGSIFRRAMNRRRSMSDEEPHAGIILGGNRLVIKESSSLKDLVPTDDDSWRFGDDEEDYYDSWKVIEDEYVNGYGGGGTLPFAILGTAADDVDAHPHVLSPPLMESLQAFLPVSQSGNNFWMKYSLVRDGASMHTFLQYARGARYSILAIETLEGEVFGAFTAEPWRKNWNYFGSGESFLWKMRKSRRNKCHSIIDQAQMESEIDVYPFTGENHCIQLCTHDKIAVGGGTYESPVSSPVQPPPSAGDGLKRHEQFLPNAVDSSMIPKHAWGFGITVEGDFFHGTSSPCITFASPSLSNDHPRGEIFEIMNLELWTLTPCDRLEDAEKLELGKLFLEKHASTKMY